MTFPALLLLAVWVLSNIFDTPDVRDELIREIVDNLPLDETEGRNEVVNLLNGLTDGAGSLGVITAGILLYSSSAAIGALRFAVETANDCQGEGPAFPKNKALDILIMAATLPVGLVLIGLIISRPLSSVIKDSDFLMRVADTFGGPLGIGALGIAFFFWMFWVLNPRHNPRLSNLVGAVTATALIGLVSYGLRVWFGISGGGSAVYGVLAGFLGLLLFVNLASMAVVFGAHLSATFRPGGGRSDPEAGGSAG